MDSYFDSESDKKIHEPMEIDFSSTDEEEMIMEVENIERFNAQKDFSSADEDEMVQELERIEKRKYTCDICNKRFMRKIHLNRHRLSHTYHVQCELCQRCFRRNDKLKRHLKNVHGLIKQTFPCNHCANVYPTYDELFTHVVENHPLQQQQQSPSAEATAPLPIQSTSSTDQPENRNPLVSNALNRAAEVIRVEPEGSEQSDLLTFLANSRLQIRDYLLSRVSLQQSVKWYLCIQIELERFNANEDNIRSTPHFRSRTYVLLNKETYNEHDLNEALQKIIESLEKFMREGSGWVMKKVLHLEIHTVRYSPINASSYIPLPKPLQHNCSILNIRNYDKSCFEYSILAAVHNINSTNVNHYLPYKNELNLHDISVPVPISKIDTFEKNNSLISINVFGFEQNDIFPLRITKQKGRLHHVNLLHLKQDNKAHYCLIRNLNAFLHRTKTSRRTSFYCQYCLHGFIRQDLLDSHTEYCSMNGPQKIELPNPGENILQFKDFEKTLRVPFVIYADFECLNSPVEDRNHVSQQDPCAFAYKVVCEDSKYTKPTVTYVGKDASKKFLECMIQEHKQVKEILDNAQPMVFTDEDRRKFESAEKCGICGKRFSDYERNHGKVAKHHNHLNSLFISASCISPCNLNCKQTKHFIPVVIHNLRGYDSHLIMQSVGLFKDKNIQCIANNMEKYISFSLGPLRFIDSLQFMNSSLDKLVENLKASGEEKFKLFQDDFPDKAEASLLLRKGVFPYEYIDSIDRLKERQLPAREHFYSNLTKQTVSESDYEHACNVFNRLHMTNLEDYMITYVKTDVSLLACVFEEFRNVCMKQYNLDPAHFYGAPGLSWSACLKMTQLKLELLTDIDMVLFIEKGVRGGVSQVSNRFKQANNPYLDGFDNNKPISYLCYEDANNLYGWAMSKHLPCSDFRWLTEHDITDLDILSIKEDSDIGYILEVCLEYPESLHDFTNDYPLCPEKMHVNDEELSPYSQQLWKKLHGTENREDIHPTRAKVEKLVLTLNDKENYVLHYRTLQLYLQLGMKLKEVRRVLQFQQRPYLKPYIDFNTECRKQAKTEFEKDFYKLLNCAIFGRFHQLRNVSFSKLLFTIISCIIVSSSGFEQITFYVSGKTLQNCRKYVDVKLAHTEKKLLKYTAKPSFQRIKIFNQDLVGIECSYVKVNFVQPIYCGMAILDLAKYFMYNHYYNYLKSKYSDKLTLMATDTDSFMYYVETDDVYSDMLQNLHLYDTSNYPSDSPLFSNDRKRTIGVMKDELSLGIMKEFVALRPKMYSFLFKKNNEELNEKRCKGISRVVVKKEILHEHYKETLLNSTQKKSTMYGLRSDNHIMYCDKINKISLSAFDDKRYWLPDGISSYAYGHYKFRKS